MKDQFIEKSKIIHGEKYDYTKVVYINTNSKVGIICPKHGEFNQTPKNHINNHGCPKCALEYKSSKLSKDIYYFISKSNKIHMNRYSYEKSIYKNNKTKLVVICPSHGEFLISPVHHYQGHGCKKCSLQHRRSTEEFIIEANKIHHHKYDYSNSTFLSLKNSVNIICNTHGEFKQRAGHHLIGHGCPNCSSSNGEKFIKNWLDKNEIKYISQKKFDDCLSLKSKKLKFDFFIPSINMCIEFDGRQHFEPLDFFGGEETFKILKENDDIKNIYCEKNNISLIRIKYNEDIEQLLKQKIINIMK